MDSKNLTRYRKVLMNSRDLVKATLEFDSPKRIPRDIWILPWARTHHPEQVKQIENKFPNDIIKAPTSCYKSVFKSVIDAYEPNGAVYSIGTFIDPWGCIFQNRQSGMIGEVKEPLLKEWSAVDTVRIPEEFLDVDIDQVNAFCKQSDKFVLGPPFTGGDLPRPFERLQFIRQSQNLYLDLADQPEEFFVLLDRMHQFYINVLELWAQTEVDGFWFMDDWGSQNALLVSPDLWRKLFKPLYRDYIEIAHQHGKYMFFHSDGYIIDIFPDLIELGLDAINSQIFCMGVEKLGKQFCGQITFWGEIDRQYILPRGSSEEIVNAVKLVQDSLYQNGGVIAQCEFGAGSKPENVDLVFQTWDKY